MAHSELQSCQDNFSSDGFKNPSMLQCIFMFFAVLIKFKSTARMESCLHLYHFSSSAVLRSPTTRANV